MHFIVVTLFLLLVGIANTAMPYEIKQGETYCSIARCNGSDAKDCELAAQAAKACTEQLIARSRAAAAAAKCEPAYKRWCNVQCNGEYGNYCFVGAVCDPGLHRCVKGTP